MADSFEIVKLYGELREVLQKLDHAGEAITVKHKVNLKEKGFEGVEFFGIVGESSSVLWSPEYQIWQTYIVNRDSLES